MEKYLQYVTTENCWFVLLGIFATAFLIQLCYYLFSFTRLAFHKPKEGSKIFPPVSVIICARNEIENLKQFLPSVLEQEYPTFQVIVVNDCSWDESEKYLEELEEKHKHLKIVTLKEQERYSHGKKFALALGIKAAEHEHLLLTDADCYPNSKTWIQEMMGAYKPETEIVIGYGAYTKQKSFVNTWGRFDTVFNAIQYFSFALGRSPYMGVGRNLSYKKSLFFKNKGFASHQHILSGDDDLFVNETANTKNTEVCLLAASFTYSKPKTNFSDWFTQKRRHISASKLYKAKDKFKLGLFFASQVLFYVTLIALLIIKFKVLWVVCAFALRLVLQMGIYGKCINRLNEKDLLILIPFYDLLIALIYPVLGMFNMLFKSKSWK